MNPLLGNLKSGLLGGSWPFQQFGRTVPTKKLLAGAKSESGQVLVITAVVLVGMIAVLGLVISSGVIQASRRQAQRAADAAAQAGAFQLLAGTNSTQRANARAAALRYASLNGVSTNNALVEIPPAASSSSVYAGSNHFIRVEVTLPTQIGLMSMFMNLATANVRASSTAGVPLDPYGVNILLMGPGHALSVSGTGDVDVGSGTIRVNSSHHHAVELNGSASITASTLYVNGNVSTMGHPTINANVVTGAPAVADPFAGRSWPDPSAYSTSSDSGGTAAVPKAKKITGNATLHPGIYYGGIEITGSGTITLLPGRYIIAGGGISQAGSASLNGTDVFIYNTRDPYASGTAANYGDLDLGGGGDVNLKAPTRTADSTYFGFAIVNDPNPFNTSDIEMKGGASQTAAGFIYAKNSEVELTGNGNIGNLGIVAKSLSVSGNKTFGALDPNRAPDANWKVTLVE